MLTYVFLPLIVTIVKYPFPMRRTAHKIDLESFNYEFGDKNSTMLIILFFPLIWLVVIINTYYLIMERVIND